MVVMITMALPMKKVGHLEITRTNQVLFLPECAAVGSSPLSFADLVLSLILAEFCCGIGCPAILQSQLCGGTFGFGVSCSAVCAAPARAEFGCSHEPRVPCPCRNISLKV